MPRAHNFSRKQRAEIALRANGCCERCGAKLKTGEGQADHVLPVELGGASEIENGEWLCVPCHAEKTADDVRRIRKSDRQRDWFVGSVRPTGSIPCRPGSTRGAATRPLTKALPPRRPLYHEE